MQLWMGDRIFTQHIFWISIDVVTVLFGLLHGWYHMKLLPSQWKFCVYHATMHQFTVSLNWNHICCVYVCLAVTCHLHFWQYDQDLLHATVVTCGCNWYQINKSQHRKLGMEKNLSCCSYWDSNPRPFSMNPSLYHSPGDDVMCFNLIRPYS